MRGKTRRVHAGLHEAGAVERERHADRLLEERELLPEVVGAEQLTGVGGVHDERVVGEPERVETAFKILEHLAANPGRGIERAPGATPFDAIYRYRPR